MSLLEPSSLDEFLLEAEMEGRPAEVIRASYSDIALVEPKVVKKIQTAYTGNYHHTHLKIPRRPQWTMQMTAEEIDRNETEAFLQWRRELAAAEEANEAFKLTPFEKNIDVWRQLWRAVEKCDLLLQIVDARNPMFY